MCLLGPEKRYVIHVAILSEYCTVKILHVNENLFLVSIEEELAGLVETGEKLKQQQQESTRRENVLVMRLATKEQEMQDLLVRTTEKQGFIHNVLFNYNMCAL